MFLNELLLCLPNVAVLTKSGMMDTRYLNKNATEWILFFSVSSTSIRFVFLQQLQAFDFHTENASRNIPNTMCGLVGTFLISILILLISKQLISCSLIVTDDTIRYSCRQIEINFRFAEQ
jgi:hypothetical protein